ncbi:hypothetical protein CO683_39705 [Bradyrhizobium ottawaense]|nr:hypothetical protein CO683_39705 [Bradyrhizobium ottawaense]
MSRRADYRDRSDSRSAIFIVVFIPGSAQTARFRDPNLVHYLDSENFVYRYIIFVDVPNAAVSHDPEF